MITLFFGVAGGLILFYILTEENGVKGWGLKGLFLKRVFMFIKNR